MNKFRFLIDGQPTEWEVEYVRCGPDVHTAVQRITELRRLHPHAAISIEREGESARERPPTFRYDILVKHGLMPVVDEDGTHLRKVSGRLQTRPFYESEREQVLTELNQRFPDAQLMEVRCG